MYDFAIVGSGVSGGRMAWELVRGGAKCILLEAGREFGARTFPNNEIDSSTQLFWGGGLELSTDGRLGFLRGKCLGGTSIVNQALLDRFDSIAWDDWRSRSGISFFNETEMAPHYNACAAELSISEIPAEHYNRNAKIFTSGLDRHGYGWKPLERAQGDCQLGRGSDCIVCLGGCPRDSKQSSLVTTIRSAREKGLEVRSEFEAHHVEYLADEVKIVGRRAGRPEAVTARKVVLAAGALGNTAILLQSNVARKLPALGTAFTCHPQFMTYAVFDDLVDAHKGAFQAVKSDDRRFRLGGFKLENVFAPPIATAMLMPGFAHAHGRLMKKFRHMASMEVALRDEPSGVVRVARSGKILIDKKLTPQDKRLARDGLKLVRELFAGSGAREVFACEQGFGLHLMGGCPMGTNGATSVVDPEFRVHGFSNLIVADSSVFPAAPGINPSFTIMALSERAGRAQVAS